jgi:hypothetical protein
MDDVLKLDKELIIIKCLNAYELLRYLPKDVLLKDDGAMLNGLAPLVFINRFKTSSPRLAKIAKKLWTLLTEADEDIVKRGYDPIFACVIEEGFESNKYEDRVAAASSVIELAKLLPEDTLAESPLFAKVLESLL